MDIGFNYLERAPFQISQGSNFARLVFEFVQPLLKVVSSLERVNKGNMYPSGYTFKLKVKRIKTKLGLSADHEKSGSNPLTMHFLQQVAELKPMLYPLKIKDKQQNK